MAAPTAGLWFEDIRPGAEFRTVSHEVTADAIADFAALTLDHHPLHADPAYARARGFPGVIAHGLYALALIEGLKTSLGLHAESSIASLGWDAVRFVRPVSAGDTVHVVFRFDDKRASARPGRGVVTETLRLLNQHGECVVEARHAALVACREPAAA